MFVYITISNINKTFYLFVLKAGKRLQANTQCK